MMSVNPIPEGYRTITPYLIVTDVNRQIEFIQKAFNGDLITQMDGSDGSIIHAEVRIADSRVMMGNSSDEYPPMPAMLYVYVENVDDVYQQALHAGGESLQAPEDQFYGDRTANVKDPLGNIWSISTHIEDVSDEEMARRLQEG